MTRRLFILAFLAAVRATAVDWEATQVPLVSSLKSDSSQSDTWPIHKIAIIGAGPGGIIAYRELSQTGYDVHVFERDDSPGGNWHYTDETPLNAPVPNAEISVADFTPSLPPKGAKLPYIEEYHNEQIGGELRRSHRAPKPIWASLMSNAPAPIQQIRELPWPDGTPWELPQQKLQNYLRAFASWHGINTNDGSPHISYNTRVELVQKRYAEDGSRIGWTLTVKEVLKTSSNTTRATWTAQDFDAVVVATGRYNAPNMPNIEGLSEWAKRFPDRISHSRQYRRPKPFSNQTVLIVGGATSGVEISRDIIHHVRKVYQSVRPDKATVPHFDLRGFLRRLHPNVTLVPEIKRFLPINGSRFNEGQVELVNGTIISGVDHIIFGTGYRYTFPFLPQYHNASIGVNDTVPRGTLQPIITDGTHIRSLYLDTFYIDDPTLAFINVNVGIQSFIYAEFLSLAIAKVWAGKADFPSTAELWRRYDEVVKDRGGYGKHFQFLGADRMRDLLRFFQGWLNDAAVKYGGRQIDGLPKGNSEITAIWIKAQLGNPADFVVCDNNHLILDFGLNSTEDHAAHFKDGIESWAEDVVFNDNW